MIAVDIYLIDSIILERSINEEAGLLDLGKILCVLSFVFFLL